MSKAIVVSVVRDYEMYRRCVAGNCNLSECRLIDVDNREKNDGIPILYNRVIERLGGNDDCWLVFCHEDFEVMEPMVPWLDRMDKESIYGPIGGVISKRRHWLFGEHWFETLRGEIFESRKDGGGSRRIGTPVHLGTEVETVDCMCVIVHSSLIVKYGLRFDERLSFDLYAEDFCINAFLKDGVRTRVLPIQCQHFSRGSIQPRFFTQLSWLACKYPMYEAFGSVGYMIGGGRTRIRRFQKKGRAFLDRYAPFAVGWCFKLIG